MQVQEYMKPFLAAAVLNEQTLENLITDRCPEDQRPIVETFLPLAHKVSQYASVRRPGDSYDELFQESALALHKPARYSKNSGMLCKNAKHAVSSVAFDRVRRNERLIKVPKRVKMGDATPDAAAMNHFTLAQSSSAVNYEYRTEQKQLREALYDFIDLLPPEERTVIIRSFGLEGDRESNSRLAGSLDTREKFVGQIKERALQRMRDLGAIKALRAFWFGEA